MEGKLISQEIELWNIVQQDKEEIRWNKLIKRTKFQFFIKIITKYLSKKNTSSISCIDVLIG